MAERLTVLHLPLGPAYAQDDPLRASLAGACTLRNKGHLARSLCERKSKMPYCIKAVCHITERRVSSSLVGKLEFLKLLGYSVELFFYCVAADASFFHCSFYYPSIARGGVLVV